jgi:hypothetical protein
MRDADGRDEDSFALLQTKSLAALTVSGVICLLPTSEEIGTSFTLEMILELR